MKQTEQRKQATKVIKWLTEINTVKESKLQQAYEKNGEKIVKAYRNADALQMYSSGGKAPQRVLYNVLWSNVQIQKPLLYARTPKIVVERRHKDSDPIARLACKIAERATAAMMDMQKDRFDFVVKAAVEDRLLPGMGVARVRYDADFGANQDTDPVSGNEVEPGAVVEEETEGVESEGQEVEVSPMPLVNTERVVYDYIHWLDFFHSRARHWYEVKWVAFRAYMSRSELVKRFGEVGEQVELTANPNKSRKKMTPEEEAQQNQAEVYEIWDLPTKSVIWVCEGYKDAPLDEQPDPLRLDGFFPIPMPLMATTTTDSLYPTPDYKIYEGLADELDYVTKRISAMVECIRYVGAHAASLGEEIKNVLKLNDGQTWPVQGWQAFLQDKGGLAGAVNWFPFDQCVAALGPLWQHQQNLQAQIDLITGIPDIVRGASDPSETAAAVQRKSRWTMLKAAEKQGDVQRFCKELVSKTAQIIFEPGLFNDQTIGLLANVDGFPEDEKAQFPQALGLLRDDRLRTFKVDIETDSTIATDEDEDQEQRMNYMQVIGQLVSSIQNVAQYRPELMRPIVQSALFAVRAFRTGRELEGAWETAWQQIEDADAQALANPPQPPPDPAMMKLQLDGQKLQQDGQFEAQRLQLDAQKAAQDFEIKSQELQIKAQEVFSKQQLDQMDQELERFKAQFAQYVEGQRLELERYATVLSEREKLIEENRLKQQETIETVKLLQQRIDTTAAAPAKEAALPVVNVHLGGGVKEVRTRRDPLTGELVGRLSEVKE